MLLSQQRRGGKVVTNGGRLIGPDKAAEVSSTQVRRGRGFKLNQ